VLGSSSSPSSLSFRTSSWYPTALYLFVKYFAKISVVHNAVTPSLYNSQLSFVSIDVRWPGLYYCKLTLESSHITSYSLNSSLAVNLQRWPDRYTRQLELKNSRSDRRSLIKESIVCRYTYLPMVDGQAVLDFLSSTDVGKLVLVEDEGDAGSEAPEWELWERREREEDRRVESEELGAVREVGAGEEPPLLLPTCAFMASGGEA